MIDLNLKNVILDINYSTFKPTYICTLTYKATLFDGGMTLLVIVTSILIGNFLQIKPTCICTLIKQLYFDGGMTLLILCYKVFL